MRARLIAAIVLTGAAAVSTAAVGQEMGSGKRHHGREQRSAQQPSKANDGGYNAALKRIPNQKPVDPWKDMR